MIRSVCCEFSVSSFSLSISPRCGGNRKKKMKTTERENKDKQRPPSPSSSLSPPLWFTHYPTTVRFSLLLCVCSLQTPELPRGFIPSRWEKTHREKEKEYLFSSSSSVFCCCCCCWKKKRRKSSLSFISFSLSPPLSLLLDMAHRINGSVAS